MKNLRKKLDLLLDRRNQYALDEAKELLLNESRMNNIEAQILLADFICKYEPKDAGQALDWLLKASASGSGQAAYSLYRIYDTAEDGPMARVRSQIPPDAQQAQQWLQKSVELDYFQALWMFANQKAEKNEIAEALGLLDKLLALKMDIPAEQREEYNSTVQMAKELKGKYKVEQKDLAESEQNRKDAISAKPAELYNLALKLLDTKPANPADLVEAKRLLHLSSEQGLVAARKKLATLKD